MDGIVAVEAGECQRNGRSCVDGRTSVDRRSRRAALLVAGRPGQLLGGRRRHRYESAPTRGAPGAAARLMDGRLHSGCGIPSIGWTGSRSSHIRMEGLVRGTPRQSSGSTSRRGANASAGAGSARPSSPHTSPESQFCASLETSHCVPVRRCGFAPRGLGGGVACGAVLPPINAPSTTTASDSRSIPGSRRGSRPCRCDGAAAIAP